MYKMFEEKQNLFGRTGGLYRCRIEFPAYWWGNIGALSVGWGADDAATMQRRRGDDVAATWQQCVGIIAGVGVPSAALGYIRVCYIQLN
jgi:hypothetical protein